MAAPSIPFTQEDLEHRFNYHAPDEAKAATHEKVRKECLDLALMLKLLCPDGRELALAITNLEQTMYWANAAIARS